MLKGYTSQNSNNAVETFHQVLPNNSFVTSCFYTSTYTRIYSNDLV